MEVVCSPRVLIVVHRRCEDHGKDLQLSQPMLEVKGKRGEGKIKRGMVLRRGCNEMEKIQILTVRRKESNEHMRKEWTGIRKEK